jgi:NhaA family Na+:H+ antiporter
LVLFAILVQRRNTSWWLLVPLAGLTWTFVHESGVHATVAGVLLGFTVPVLRAGTSGDRDDGPGLAEHFEHTIRPLSSGVAVPVFAFFAAGVAFGGVGGLVSALQEPVAMGIVAGLVIGKVVGIFGTTWLVASVTPASLDSSLKWVDVIGAAMLAGIGFTVSLLIGELAFAGDPDRQEYVKVGVLFGSVVSATLATVLLRSRNRHYRRQHEHEVRDRSALSVE